MVKRFIYRFKVRKLFFGIFSALAYYSPPFFLFRYVKSNFRDLFLENRTDTDKFDNVNYCIMVWGEYHLNLFFDFALPSLLFDGNIPNLTSQGIKQKFYVYTDNEGFFFRLAERNKFFKRLEKECSIEVINFADLHAKYPGDQIKAKCFVDCGLKSIRERAKLLVVNADFVFSNDTLSNLYSIGKNLDVCVCFSHARVDGDSFTRDPALIRAISGGQSTLSGAELVKLALNNPHRLLKLAFDDSEPNFTNRGISLRRVSDKLVCCTSSMPSPFFLSLRKRDLYLFSKYDDYNIFDRRWLRQLFIEGRLKYIGCSDVAFMAEITPSEEAIDASAYGRVFNDGLPLEKRKIHSKSFMQFVSMWRS